MVDLTRGRKQEVDTKERKQESDFVTFYSPNALQDTQLCLDDSPRDGNPFHPESSTLRPTWEDFRKPRPWSLAFGWISFVPTVSLFNYSSTPPLDVLVHIPPIVDFTDDHGEVKGYGLSDVGRWRNLEQQLYDAVVALKTHYHIPIVLPFLPRAFGYDKVFRSKNVMGLKARLSREWFLVWMGALSYCIAWTRSPSDPHESYASKRYPQWRAVLEGKGLRPDWMDDVENSFIGQFSMYRSRAGTVLDLLDPQPRQPTPEWLVRHGIPVWYRWDKKERVRAEEDENFAKLGPPAIPPWMHWAHTSPHPPAPPTARLTPVTPITAVVESTSSLEAAQRNSVATQAKTIESPEAMREEAMKEEAMRGKWRAEFFKTREEEHQKFLQNETPDARQRRLNRLREPPLASAKVFEWFPDEDDSNKYRRIPVNSKARVDTLDSYGEQQRVYDPFYNEWNCCSDFGDDDDDDYEEELDSQSVTTAARDSAAQVQEPLPESATQILKPTTTQMEHPHTSLSQYDNLSDDVDVDQRSAHHSGLGSAILETFSRHYGLCRPVPGTVVETTTGIPGREASLFLRMSCKGEDGAYIEIFKKSQEYTLALSFFSAFLTTDKPAPGTWDLVDDCMRPLRTTTRFTSVRKRPIPCLDQELKDSYRKTDVYYVFEGPDPAFPWKFATLTASTAALACRLPEDFTEEGLAFYFAQRAIPFRIFYPRTMLPPLPPQLEQSPYVRPVRQYNHTFTPDDYDGYVRQRTLLLGQSHMQAAIKRGGIIWRLAIPVLGLRGVCRPPTRWGSYSRPVLPQGEYCDDLLTSVEMDMICGIYECTNDAGQTKLLSWWPLPRYYEKEENGENYDYWTLDREQWYKSRLDTIENHGAQPLSYHDWKVQLHGQGAIRRFHQRIELSSQNVFNS